MGVFASPAQAADKYASIIIDADTHEILHARNIDAARYPASLTKMMTLYLTFDALERGEITKSDPLRISKNAARTAPVKLGLKSGRTISVHDAIQALAVRSANDAAVVLAEHLGKTELGFADMMTMKAKALGMQSSIFKNPHGLPHKAQTTTARDMAKLADALLRNHRKHFHYFSQKHFRYNGRTYANHNTLLGRVDGVDGFKTGFTNASGYNLVLSAERDGRRIIAAVLGGASGSSRDQHMAKLIERGFKVLQSTRAPVQTAQLTSDERASTVRTVLPAPKRISAYSLRSAYDTQGAGLAQPETIRVVNGSANSVTLPNAPAMQNWAVQIGAFSTLNRAQTANEFFMAQSSLGLSSARPVVLPVTRTDGTIFRARLAGLSYEHANGVCKSLAQTGQQCHVIAPS